jgi:hypothetical protein
VRRRTNQHHGYVHMFQDRCRSGKKNPGGREQRSRSEDAAPHQGSRCSVHTLRYELPPMVDQYASCCCTCSFCTSNGAPSGKATPHGPVLEVPDGGPCCTPSGSPPAHTIIRRRCFLSCPACSRVRIQPGGDQFHPWNLHTHPARTHRQDRCSDRTPELSSEPFYISPPSRSPSDLIPTGRLCTRSGATRPSSACSCT